MQPEEIHNALTRAEEAKDFCHKIIEKIYEAETTEKCDHREYTNDREKLKDITIEGNGDVKLEYESVYSSYESDEVDYEQNYNTIPKKYFGIEDKELHKLIKKEAQKKRANEIKQNLIEKENKKRKEEKEELKQYEKLKAKYDKKTEGSLKTLMSKFSDRS